MARRKTDEMLPPGLPMGSAWFTDWLSRLPVLRNRARRLAMAAGLFCLLMLVAYNQWPRLQQPAGTKEGTVRSYTLDNNTESRPAFPDTELAATSVVQLPATFWAPATTIAAVPQRQVFAHTVIAVGRNDGITLYFTPEQVGGPSFVLHPGTLRRAWYSGWQVDVLDPQRQLRGTLYLSHWGAPRLIRAGQAEENTR